MLFAVIGFIVLFVKDEINVFSNNFQNEEMNSKAIQVSQAILNPHSKYNIVTKWPEYSHAKMNDFNSDCNNPLTYKLIIDSYGLYKITEGVRRDLRLKVLAIDLITGDRIIDCGSMPTDLLERPPIFEVRRIGIDSDTKNPIELKMWIW